VADRRLAGVSTSDYWIDTGRPDQFLQANLDLIRGVRGEVSSGTSPSASVSPDATVVESVISDGAVVGAGATITGSVLLPGARVDAGSAVSASIVAGRVGAGSTVDRCVVGADHSVPAGTAVSDQRLPSPG
jgi:mannose-1-phosphate guanylyltransferase